MSLKLCVACLALALPVVVARPSIIRTVRVSTTGSIRRLHNKNRAIAQKNIHGMDEATTDVDQTGATSTIFRRHAPANVVALQTSSQARKECRAYAERLLNARAKLGQARLSEFNNISVTDVEDEVSKAMQEWTAEGRDYCRGVGAAETDTTRGIAGGEWVPTPDSELPLHFKAKEMEYLLQSHISPHQARCMPDGGCRTPTLTSSLEPLRWRWSGCDGGACVNMAELAHKMVSSGRKRFLIMGDSLYAQLYEAAECLFERSGCTLSKKIESATCHNGCSSRHVRCGSAEIELVYFEFGKLGEFKMQGKTHVVKIDDLQAELRAADVALVNQGLHGPDRRDEFIGELTAAMKDKPSLRLYWGDTTAAHFSSATGLLQGAPSPIVDLAKASPVHTFCSPLLETAVAGWDHVTVPSNITVLPFWKLTASRWDMHADWRAKGDVVKNGKLNTQTDCLHYCYSPTFYEPFMGLLAEAFQRNM